MSSFELAMIVYINYIYDVICYIYIIIIIIIIIMLMMMAMFVAFV